MRVCYSPGYGISLPAGHVFPIRKFELLHDRLLAEGLVAARDVHQPGPASLEDLATVHTAGYLAKLRDGTLDRLEVRRIGLPWSGALFLRSRLAVQGTIDAARFALADGVAGNLAGGTHHAHPDHGEGYCVLADVAVAIRVLRREGRVRRALLVDLDVHQGNGNAVIFAGDPDVFTLSLHGARNFPARKPASTLDVPLPDGTGDAAYLAALAGVLPGAIERARADLVFFLAGVDVVSGDRFGRLSLSRDGLLERDRLVLDAVAWAGVPLALVLAGGYAATPEATADLHATPYRLLAARGAALGIGVPAAASGDAAGAAR